MRFVPPIIKSLLQFNVAHNQSGGIYIDTHLLDYHHCEANGLPMVVVRFGEPIDRRPPQALYRFTLMISPSLMPSIYREELSATNLLGRKHIEENSKADWFMVSFDADSLETLLHVQLWTFQSLLVEHIVHKCMFD